MSREFNKERLNQVYEFIKRIAKGDFTYRLNPTSSHDELETIVLLLNLMKEELNVMVHQYDPQQSFISTLNLSFILDHNFRIIGYSENVIQIFELNESILDKKIKKFLDRETYLQLKTCQTDPTYLRNRILDCSIKLPNNLALDAQANFLPFELLKEKSNYFILNLFKTEQRNSFLERRLKENAIVNYKKYTYPTQVRTLLLKDRRQVIRNLHTYIMNHLDRPLPSMKELSMEIGASESKLKTGFKRMFGMSIFKYHKEQRFERSKLLLQNTEKPVSTIALDCGFISPAHFSRAFKEWFGYRPSDIRTSKLTL